VPRSRHADQSWGTRVPQPSALVAPFLVVAAIASSAPSLGAEPGDADRGAQLFGRACAACHSLQPGRSKTGPSLASVVGRQAGALPEFHRYSPALKGSGVTWDLAALDTWLTDPQTFIPGNRMPFRGIPDAQARADIIAFLAEPASEQATAREGGMGGMMGGGDELPDLKLAGPENQVTAIRHCGDTYTVATADGQEEPFWEFNLRFKTDGSDRGPTPGKPVIVGTNMSGDRAAVVFAAPAEISPFIQPGC
jgi:cytochrome c